MQQLKQQAAALLGQINTTKAAGMMSKATEAEKAVDMSAKLMIGMLAKMEEMEAKINETAS